jgi:hypothetical protein
MESFKFNRDPEDNAEKVDPGHRIWQAVGTPRHLGQLKNGLFRRCPQGSARPGEVAACTRAPRRTFLIKLAGADFQECPLDRG